MYFIQFTTAYMVVYHVVYHAALGVVFKLLLYLRR